MLSNMNDFSLSDYKTEKKRWLTNRTLIIFTEQIMMFNNLENKEENVNWAEMDLLALEFALKWIGLDYGGIELLNYIHVVNPEKGLVIYYTCILDMKDWLCLIWKQLLGYIMGCITEAFLELYTCFHLNKLLISEEVDLYNLLQNTNLTGE